MDSKSSLTPAPPVYTYHVHVEYCTACGLYPQYSLLRSLLLSPSPPPSSLPTVTSPPSTSTSGSKRTINISENVTPPRMSAFEVTVYVEDSLGKTSQKVLLYSKIKTKVIPDIGNLTDKINKWIVDREQIRLNGNDKTDDQVVFESPSTGMGKWMVLCGTVVVVLMGMVMITSRSRAKKV